MEFPAANLYVGLGFQEARATDQSDVTSRLHYCWRQSSTTNFLRGLPYGAIVRGSARYLPPGGESRSSRVAGDRYAVASVPGDPNETPPGPLVRALYDSLPRVPPMNDLS